MKLIQKNISLHDKNWFKTGGSAKFFSSPQTPACFADALTWAVQNKQEVFLLGQGANILISDAGFDGLVIRPSLQELLWDHENGLVTAGAGVDLHELIDACLAHRLSGLEEFSGIPGTVGGALYINIHYFEFLLSSFLYAATVIDACTGELKRVDPAWFNFGYNVSKLQEKKYYLVDATFKLSKISEQESWIARGRRQEIIRHRNKRYPLERTCGSFFRNFLPEELPFLIHGKKVPYVAYYLDKVGIKGVLRVGGAAVSYLHANMIVTSPGATSTDVIELAQRMQQRVFEEFGIVPQPECQLIGFVHDPLKFHPAKSSRNTTSSVEP